MATAALVISLVGLAISAALAWYARKTLDESKRANQLPTAVAFVSEYRTTDGDRGFKSAVLIR